MSQPVSAAFEAAADASVNDVTYGFLVGWDKNYDALATFFKIGTSAIEGPDFLKGAGADVTFFDKYPFQDESDNVNDITVTRMSSVKSYGSFSAQATVVLDNISKKYLPGYDPDIGAYVNKTRRPIKIAAGFDGENVQQFVGFSDRPRGSLMGQNVTMHAFDVMQYFATVEPVTKSYEGYKFNEMIEDILLELGFSTAQFDIEESLQVAPGFIPLAGMTVMQVFNKICEAEQAVMFADEQGVIRFWNRLHYAGAAYDTVDAPLYDYDNMTDLEWTDTPIVNWMIVTAKPRAIAAMQPVWQAANTIELKPGETTTVPVSFEDQDGKLPVTSLMDPVYIDDRDDLNRSYYATNFNQDGTGLPGNSDVSMTSVSLLGDVAFLEFSNTSVYSIYITEMEIHGTPAKVTDRIAVEYKDEDSIENYGINPESNNGEPIEIDNDWIQDSATAYSLAMEQVKLYGDPEQQVAGPIFADPSHQYGDVVQVRINDIEVDPRWAIVVGLELKMSMGEIISQRAVFEYRDKVINLIYFTINQSSIGGLDAIAP